MSFFSGLRDDDTFSGCQTVSLDDKRDRVLLNVGVRQARRSPIAMVGSRRWMNCRLRR